MGIEPTYSAWKAEVLPLNYTRAVLKGDRFIFHATYCNDVQHNRKINLSPFNTYHFLPVGGENYSGHPALRPSGRRTACRAQTAPSGRDKKKPEYPPEQQTQPGGGGRIRTSEG